MSLDFTAVMAAHAFVRNNALPTPGQFPIHTPKMMVDANSTMKREFLAVTPENTHLIKKDGRCYLYQGPGGCVFKSFYPRHDFQYLEH